MSAAMWNSLPRAHSLAIGLTMGSLLSGTASHADEATSDRFDPLPLMASWTPPLDGRDEASADFRPRGRSMADTPAAALPGVDSREAMSGTPAWQRLVQIETQNRVRLLTLWESSIGSLSLQAGHKGSPSLQWSTRSFRPDAARGLLDRWFPVLRKSDGDGKAIRAQPPYAGHPAERLDPPAARADAGR
jgi:hypothetical protein